jgi:ADP-ribosylglycohydrolase
MEANVEELLAFARAELKELSEQGCDTWEQERRLALIEQAGGPDLTKRLLAFYQGLAEMKPSPDFPYDEPSDLDGILARRPDGPRGLAVSLSPGVLDDRTLGAWLGRACGCMLGKPVEGWSRDRIADLMAVCGIDELDDYLPVPPENNGGIRFPDRVLPLLRGNLTCAARDDDTDYTILNLRVLESLGWDLTPRQVAETWLAHLPYSCTYTAERAAYRNFVNSIWPPQSAAFRNPYREWIGAQIRADAFGYACPGRPEEAASLAFRDACISHTGNGIYGAMWVAAMVAAAFVADEADKVLRIGLSEIPRSCRLAATVSQVLQQRAESYSAQAAMDDILHRHGSYHGVHVINNAAIVAMALLWGEKDFTRTIGLAVRAGLDTDCNGATAGSVLGAMIGAHGIPAQWTTPLNDRIETVVAGESGLTISGLAARTRKVQEGRRSGGAMGVLSGEL